MHVIIRLIIKLILTSIDSRVDFGTGTNSPPSTSLGPHTKGIILVVL